MANAYVELNVFSRKDEEMQCALFNRNRNRQVTRSHFSLGCERCLSLFCVPFSEKYKCYWKCGTSCKSFIVSIIFDRLIVSSRFVSFAHVERLQWRCGPQRKSPLENKRTIEYFQPIVVQFNNDQRQKSYSEKKF